VRRVRLRVDAVLVTLSAILHMLTPVLPSWIEVVFRVDADAGSGKSEWLFAGSFALSTVGLGLATRLEWQLSSA
jgi:hypothetical protein